MELLYVYIDRFNNINDQEFPFSKEFDIKFDSTSKKLEITRSSSYYDLKLFDAKFLNVTAIIGKNGSGKSSLLSFIKLLFSNSLDHFHNYIVVLKESKTKLLVIDKLSKGEKKVIEKVELEDGTKIKIANWYNEVTDMVDLINHSNSFSVYENETIGQQFLDISFNRSLDQYSEKSNNLLLERYDSLLHEQSKKPLEADVFQSIKQRMIKDTIPRDNFYHYDLQANLKFISEYRNKDWDFIPKGFMLSFSPYFFFNNISYFKRIGLSDVLGRLEYLLFKDRSDILNPERKIENFKTKIIIYLFLYYTISKQYYGSIDNNLKPFIEETLNTAEPENIPSQIKSFLDNSKTGSSHDPLVKIQSFTLSIEEKFNSYKGFNVLNWNTYAIWESDEVYESLNEIFEIWMDKDFIFSFKWQDLSAGESALLTLFSKINFVKAYADYKDFVWILIDEGDLYLHPEWQRTFFSDLHKYIPLFFKDKKGIQLFLTSHSPFIVSDLAKENIILLDKEKESGLCKVVTNDNLQTTFGANIHSLFKDSFFMESGLMGQFAKEKILNLIDFLKSNVLKSEKYSLGEESSLVLINMIGEPIIRKQLQDMWNEKFLKKEMLQSNTELARQVRQLTRKLKLEKIKNAAKKNK